MSDRTKHFPPAPLDPRLGDPDGGFTSTVETEAFNRLQEPHDVKRRKPFRVPADSKVLRVERHESEHDFLGVQPTALDQSVEIQLLEEADLLEEATREDLTTDVFAVSDIDEQLAQGEESHIIGGRYRIVEALAMGGMGAVFKVTHLRLHKDFALKIIISDRSADANMQKFFFREARVLSQMNHPNIVQVTDFGRDDRFGSYLVMEYLHGESLFDRLERDGKMDLGVALQIGLQIAEALDYMHCRDVIHCDIKPENAFLCRDTAGTGMGEGVKLIDFGLSRTMVRDARLDRSEVGGTPAYAAPEQLAGYAPQPSMDIYGVGVLLYSMITGWPPYSGTMDEILQQKRHDDLVPPSRRLGKRLNPDVESLILWAAARDPNKRPVSMAQLIAELRTVILRLGYEVPASAVQRARPVTGKHNLPGREENRAFFAGCPWPVFLVDRFANFVAASPAFCAVVETPFDQLLGMKVSRSRLGEIHPQIESDFGRARQRRTAVMRRIDFRTPDGDHRALILWIAPQITADAEVERSWGILMPIDA